MLHLIFPKVPQSLVGILRVPQLPPPVENPTSLLVTFAKLTSLWCASGNFCMCWMLGSCASLCENMSNIHLLPCLLKLPSRGLTYLTLGKGQWFFTRPLERIWNSSQEGMFQLQFLEGARNPLIRDVPNVWVCFFLLRIIWLLQLSHVGGLMIWILVMVLWNNPHQ